MIKKKRKIKVPAASFGLFGGQNSRDMERAAQASLQATHSAPQIDPAYIGSMGVTEQPVPTGNQAVQQQQQQQGGKTRGINSNTMSKIGTVAGALPGAVSMLTSIGSESTATTGADAAKQSVQDIMGGAATGMQLGSVAGPMGAIAGAAIGAGIGLIGKSGREAEMTSFTDYDEGTLGTGLIGAFGNKRLRKERARIKQNAYANRAAVQGTGQLQADYNLEHGQIDTNTFAYGGMPTSLAYVDDGELISTPDGTISKVPELGRPTDSNLVQLPGGSKILSDKLKVPGTKKTFAQVGEEMMATKKSKFNDIYAQNAAKLNEMNNKSIHDQLFEMQEAVKAKKGIKRKYKNAVIAAEGGDEVPEYLRRPTDPPVVDYPYAVSWGVGNTVVPAQKIDSTEQVIAQPTKPNGRISPQVNQWAYGDNFAYLRDGKYDQNYLNFINNALTQDMIDRAIAEQPQTFSRFRNSNPNYRPTLADVRKWATDYKPSDFHRFAEYLYNNRARLSKDMPELTMAGLNLPTAPGAPSRSATESSLDNGTAPVPTSADRQPVRPRKPGDTNPVIDWTGIASGIAGLAPILSNLNTRPEYQNTIYNPFANAIMTTMRNRRYDISPAIRDIERNRAIANYNESQMNTNTGANMAFRLQNASNTARAIADVRSQESNVNNQYLADYADTLNDLGRQWANESIRVQDANMANRAQARNIRRAGLSGLSQWFQNRELMRNQRNRDNMMMALYDPFLEAGFTTGDLTNFRNWLRRTNG